MTIVAVGSGCASPGVSAVSVGLGFAVQARTDSRPVLIEADPDGGSLALRFGLPASPSFATLASDISRSSTPGMVESHGVDLRGLRVVAAPPDPLVVRWSLERGSPALVRALESMAQPVVIDLGRIRSNGPNLGLAQAADLVVVVLRPALEDIQRTMFAVRTVRSIGGLPGLVVVGDKPHHPAEVADVIGCPLIGVVPDDPVMARALVGGLFRPRAFQRSTLWRSIDAIASSVFASAVAPAPTDQPAGPPPQDRHIHPPPPAPPPAHRQQPSAVGGRPAPAPSAPQGESR